jgi:hypothetical protein
MIYFMQPVAGGPVKIGCSDDVEQRREQLEAHYGRDMVILATMPGGIAEERAVHARFAHLRFGRTEQFRPAPDLMAFIGRPLLVGSNPDAVEAMKATGASPTVRVYATARWAEWLERGARHCRTDVAKLIDAAVADYLRARGFDEPPPERIP